MIKLFNVRRMTWKEIKYEWGDLMRSKGLQQINREPPTGYEVAPDLITDQVEGEGFVIYPPRIRPKRSKPHPHLQFVYLRQPVLWDLKFFLMKPVNTKSLFHVLSLIHI